MSKVSKKQRVLDALQEHGSITVFYAFNHLGETRLSAKVDSLRKEGHVIELEMLKGKNKLGDNINYGRYHYKGKATV